MLSVDWVVVVEVRAVLVTVFLGMFLCWTPVVFLGIVLVWLRIVLLLVSGVVG